ncbi:hypothetical protein RhiirB3_453714 [Rhizophagus irregularis]|nr:hypothetical protein RhiirB3_453714 [Rhizophagus irregularis]
MPSKLKWRVNDLCEFKSPKDKQWHLGKITHFAPITSIFTVEISGITEGILAKEGWQVFDYHISEFLRPVYDSQKLSVSHKAINPITGEDWFFISDPTHVFKKLRNNLSKSHIGEKNAREIIFNKKEISWKHIKAEHTLSKEVEDALRSIKELKDILKGTRHFIRYSRKYWQIMHSKINFKSLKDPRIDTLKEIRDWFICGNKQKTESKEWISLQCQFDLILSINGFLEMLEYILKKYPNSMVQPRRISQDVLEGLFGVIREIGGDSSTHTLKSYGYALNKCQVVALVSSEVKSINYGKADGTETGITTLTRRDYRKENQDNNKKNNYIHQKYNSRLEQLSPISHDVFESLLVDDLIMGKINIPLGSHDKNVEQENSRIFHLQNERYNLIEAIFYEDSIDELLQKWQNIVRKMAHNAVPKKIGVQWLASWNSHLEISLNNFQCSGSWYQDFLVTANLNGSSTQRLVAYMLLQKVIKFTFSKKTEKTHLTANQYLIPEKIIVLEPAEASKFSYIVGWIVYKLTKSDNATKSHPKFETIYAYLMSLNSEQVVYEQDVQSQTTNIIPGQEFLQFMYKMESLIFQLFEKHKEFGPNILQYIHNSLLCNIPLLESFNILLNTSTCQKLELKDDVKNCLYERIVSTYMKSRQKSWRRFNDLIPEKGTSSLRENLKSMRNNNQIKNKHTLKKTSIPKDPVLGLKQLQVWARLNGAEEEFTKIFLVSELQ